MIRSLPVVLLFALAAAGQASEYFVVRGEVGPSENPGVLARVVIEAEAANISLAGGAEALAEVEFRVADSGHAPGLAYVENAGELSALLELRQPDTGRPPYEFGPPDPGLDFDAWNVSLDGGAVRALDVYAEQGSLHLDLSGMAALDSADCAVTSGSLVADLSGEWDHAPALLRFDVGIGLVELTLPDDVGVRVSVECESGSREVEGLARHDDGTYRNAAWGESDVNLDIQLSGGCLADVRLRVASED
ncbi:hypothetical protein JXB37_00760 [candidate division WOR-3 bacterium]|nr:hypothetical protein [candidate division WOR-3 bacterium]